jgi:hypothetical protein
LLQYKIHYPDAQKPPTNDLFRARGLVFKLLGAVCAYLEKQQALYIYENGFGAINLPYRLSEKNMLHRYPGLREIVSRLAEQGNTER